MRVTLKSTLRQLLLAGVAGSCYPLGMIPGLDQLVATTGVTPRTRRTREAVVLVEGWGANTSTWFLAGRVCAAAGFKTRSFGYRTFGSGVEREAERLAAEVSLLHAAGYERVHLVGHSLGGIVCSVAASRFIDPEILGQVVTVASPHRGSGLGRLPVGHLGRAVAHGSALLEQLRGEIAEAISRGVRFTAIAAKDDPVVLARDARLEVTGARNFEMAGVNHLSVTFDSRVLDLLVSILEDEEAALVA